MSPEVLSNRIRLAAVEGFRTKADTLAPLVEQYLEETAHAVDAESGSSGPHALGSNVGSNGLDAAAGSDG
jgi:hypothetical protein